MRTILGATALAVGVFMSLLSVNTAVAFSDAAVWLHWAAGGLTLSLLVAALFLLRGGRTDGARRWPVVVGAFAAGLIGLVLALVTSDSGIVALGDRYVYDERTGSRELIRGDYALNVGVFRRVVYQRTGPSVERADKGRTSIGPSQQLEAVMLAAGWSMTAAYVLLFSLVGAALGAGVERLTRRTN